MLKQYVPVVFLFVFLSEACLHAELSKNALRKAESHLLRLRTIDCTFNYSKYDVPVRFRASGIMTRSDACFLKAHADSEETKRELSMAFNAEIYQDKRMALRTMRCSRTRLNSKLTSGPCWTPIEYAFKWCQTLDRRLSWQSLHDPLTWNIIRDLSDPLAEPCIIKVGDSNYNCVRITIRNSPVSTSRVYLAVNRGYFPVKREVVSLEGKITSTILVESLIEIPNKDEGEEIWFPKIISGHQIPMKENANTARNFLYTIDEDLLKVNHRMDESVFTLDYKGMLNVYLDGDEVYLPKKDKVVSVNPPARTGIVNLSKKPGSQGRLVVFLVMGNLLFFVMLFYFLYRRRL